MGMLRVYVAKQFMDESEDHICLYGYAASDCLSLVVAISLKIISACMGMLRVNSPSPEDEAMPDHICLYGYAASGLQCLPVRYHKDHICLYGYAASIKSLLPESGVSGIISACMGMLRAL